METNLFPEMESPDNKGEYIKYPLRISTGEHDMLEALMQRTGKKQNALFADAVKALYIKVFNLGLPHTVAHGEDEAYTMHIRIRLNAVLTGKLVELTEKLGHDKSVILRSALHEKYKAVVEDGEGSLF